MIFKNHFINLLIKYSRPNFEYNKQDFEGLNWEEFQQFLEWHRLFRILFPILKKLGVVPAKKLDLLNTKNTLLQKQALLQAAELQNLAAFLKEHQIPVIFFKGPLLGQQYYGNYTLRESKDIDILIREQDLEKTYQLLKGKGYDFLDVLWNSPKQKRLYLKYYYHYCLYNPNDFIQLEIHWRFSSFDSNMAINEIWNKAIHYQMGDIPVLTLSKQDNFLFLCNHGFRHQWKRLFWVYDIYKIILEEGFEFLEDTFAFAKENNQTLPFLSSCYLVQSVFGLDMPKFLSKEFEKHYVFKRLCMLPLHFIEDNHLLGRSSLRYWAAFISSFKKNIFNYVSIFYLYGFKSFVLRVKLIFINPKYWTIYSFTDKYFILNYLIVPFLWSSYFLKKKIKQ